MSYIQLKQHSAFPSRALITTVNIFNNWYIALNIVSWRWYLVAGQCFYQLCQLRNTLYKSKFEFESQLSSLTERTLDNQLW